ncbi:Tyrosine--tRNA ligase [Mycena indigotica]|uniref:Tyrosine--tRNA ligase n=1 Tax=Mycena indigotica TaxID=2126181 RepID=A0A8H6WEE3_9AGAR|nr:Tyrosine--tRNA ligase [Mycena indigotica]KAF7315629.1 Tyrosine--tRNA ligase [Mycena indigotica]
MLRVFRLASRSLHTKPKASGLLDELRARGLINDVTAPDYLQASLERNSQTVYAGIDPTAPALHVGHLLPLVCLLQFHIHGHNIIPLIGGATGLIGDPSGRTIERETAEEETTLRNTNSLIRHVETFFQRALLYAADRVDLPSNLVRTRLESKQGISFTEFTYQLLQAYDFYHLHKHFGCSIQLGGSDQWGNILGGISLIGKINATNPDDPPSAFGLTTPLLTTSTGAKFGKSAGNAVWMDPQLTSVFNFYQYFVKATDAEVEGYMKLLTLMSLDDIHKTMEAHQASPEQRIAQKVLAGELTELVHSKSGRSNAETMTKIMFETDLHDLKAAKVIDAFKDNGNVHYVSFGDLQNTPIVKLASKYGLASSTSAARALVLARGLYSNNVPVGETSRTLTNSDLIDDQVVVLKAGKDRTVILALEK